MFFYESRKNDFREIFDWIRIMFKKKLPYPKTRNSKLDFEHVTSSIWRHKYCVIIMTHKLSAPNSRKLRGFDRRRLGRIIGHFQFWPTKGKSSTYIFDSILRWTKGTFLNFSQNRNFSHNLFLCENWEKYFRKFFENLEENFFQKILFWNFEPRNL